jgi:thiol-disulfide isomerase/thioredoxin
MKEMEAQRDAKRAGRMAGAMIALATSLRPKSTMRKPVHGAGNRLAKQTGTRDSLVEFGVPTRLAGVSAAFLILSELAIAGLLIPISTVWYGGIGALALLVLFSAAIAVNLLQHRKPNCNCFGQLHSAPIGWPTFVRNLALTAFAATIVLDGRNPKAVSVFGWTHSLRTVESISLALSLVNLVLLAATAAFIVEIVRQRGRMLLRLEALEQGAGTQASPLKPLAVPKAGLPLRTRAPEFELAALDGSRTSLGILLSSHKPVLLLFSHPDCGPCEALLPDISSWQRDLDDIYGRLPRKATC